MRRRKRDVFCELPITRSASRGRYCRSSLCEVYSRGAIRLEKESPGERDFPSPTYDHFWRPNQSFTSFLA
jgi:hypothetical protein